MKIKTYSLSVILPIILSSNPVNKQFEHTLHGIVANKKNGKPIAGIYLYTVKGEEEAISNSKGEFKFVTWQRLPVTVHVHNNEGENIRVVVSNPVEHIKVKL